MHVLNIMLSPGMGGIEQASLDYAEALQTTGHRVSPVVRAGAKILPQIQTLGLTPVFANPWSSWEPFTPILARNAVRKLAPNAMICHGNRAMHFAKWANPGVPVIACTHNYQTKRFVHADVVIALTPDLKRHVESQGVPPEKIHLVPNCVRIPERRAPRNRSSRPRISAMGRFVPKKGFDVLLNALADLKQRGVEFSCFLGGDGPESEALRALTNRLGLANDVTFAGWVTDKAQFFANTDIFCVPSRHEPFGIIVLEAMAAGLPVITTDSEGPTAIVRHGHDGLITPKDDPIALSAALERLIKDGNLSESLARNGHTNAERNYALPVVAAKIDEVVRKAVESYVRRSWLR